MARATDWHRNNGNLFVMNNGFIQRMPRYYKEKIFNPEERQLLGEEGAAKAESDYWKEYIRLEKLGYKNPDLEIESRAVEASLNVTKKGKDGLSL